MVVAKYERMFVELCHFGQDLVNTKAKKIKKILKGLHKEIKWLVTLRKTNFYNSRGILITVKTVPNEAKPKHKVGSSSGVKRK